MIKHFPLPYSSLTSCYRGIIGKESSGIPLKRPLVFNDKNSFELGKNCKWTFIHVGLIVPHYSEYLNLSTHRIFSDLELETNIKGVKHVYHEKLEIEHVMKDVFHLFIEAVEYLPVGKSNTLLKKRARWMSSSEIHHLSL